MEKDIAKQLHDRRVESGHSIEGLAFGIDCSPNTVWRFENNKGSSLSTLQKIADFLQCEVMVFPIASLPTNRRPETQ